jgi:hypothetical protein
MVKGRNYFQVKKFKETLRKLFGSCPALRGSFFAGISNFP